MWGGENNNRGGESTYVSVDLLFPGIVLLDHLVAIDSKLLAQVGMIHDTQAGISQCGWLILDEAVLFVLELRNGIRDEARHYNGNAATHGSKNLVLYACSNSNGSYCQTSIADGAFYLVNITGNEDIL